MRIGVERQSQTGRLEVRNDLSTLELGDGVELEGQRDLFIETDHHQLVFLAIGEHLHVGQVVGVIGEMDDVVLDAGDLAVLDAAGALQLFFQFDQVLLQTPGVDPPD